MKKIKLFSLVMAYLLCLTGIGNISMADETNISSSNSKFKATLDGNDRITATIDGEEYTFGEEIELSKGTHEITFNNVPEGYIVEDIMKTGVRVLPGEPLDEEDKTTQTLKFDILENRSSIKFVTLGLNYRVFIDTIETDDTKVKLYGKPGSSFKLYKNSIEYKNGVFDKNGQAVVNIDRAEALNTYSVISKDEKGAGFNTTIVNSIIKELSINLKSMKVGDKEITGKFTAGKISNILGEITIDTAPIIGYIYNSENNEFKTLDEITILDNNFTINYEEGLANGDVIYVSCGVPANSVHDSALVGTERKTNVKRLSGPNRLVTAVKIARESYPKTDAVIIANGYISADALAAGPLANELNAPILLVEDDFVIQDVVSYIKESGVKKIYIAGGPNSVTDKVVSNLKPSISTETERISGSDRYETSLKIAEKLVENHDYKKSVIFANGTDAKDADALAASTYATQSKQAIVLTRENATTDKVKTGLKSLGITSVEIVGGPKTVSDKA
ncbi:MAG TPA: cell wall-binding repeat-containing protein, partial [Gallicola sp.]|nr:cell wall-binding repeat-containing protein [Gallicola sp.]